MMSSLKHSHHRRRGVFLTSQGKKKLYDAKDKLVESPERQKQLEEQGRNTDKKITIEELHLITGLDSETISKIQKGTSNKLVDLNSLNTLFWKLKETLGLEDFELTESDYEYPKHDLSPTIGSKKQSNRNSLRNYPNIKLPPQLNELIGRKSEIKQLLEYLSPENRNFVIIVDGIGGVGKTSLVLEAAYLCLEASCYGESPLNAPKFDSIIFTSAKESYLLPDGIIPRPQKQGTLREIFRVIAQTLNDSTITQATPENQINRVYESLSRQRTLLIVDNLETIRDKKEVLGFLYDFLPPSTKAIITTREKVVTYVPIRLNCLPEQDSISLIQQQAEDKKITLSEEDSRRIYQRFGGVPVALIYIVGQLASNCSLGKILNPSTQLSDNIAHFCFKQSMDDYIGQPPHQLLMSLALFPRGASEKVLAEVSGLKAVPLAVSQGLAQLTQLLMVYLREDRYKMLPLTREYALAELSIYSDFDNQVRERWVNFYLEFSQKYGGKDWQEWHIPYDHLDAEWRNLLEVLDWCANQELYEIVKKLWRNLNQFASLYSYWDERLEWLDWLLNASEKHGELDVTLEAISESSFTLIQMGRLKEAENFLLQSWKMRSYTDSGNRVFLAQQFALLRIKQRDFKDAKYWLNKEEELVDQSVFDDRERKRRKIAINYLKAKIFEKTNDHNSAKKYYQEIIINAKEIGWQRRKNSAQNLLARIKIQEGSLTNAEKLLNEGYPEVMRNKEKKSIARYQSSFALLEDAKGNSEKACEWADKSKDGFKRLGMSPEEEEMQSLYKHCFRSKL